MIIVLVHSPTETGGLILDQLQKARLLFQELHLYKNELLPNDLTTIDGLVVMGGPMNVDEVDLYPFLKNEVNLIRQMISANKPVLGICLGAQLIAKALGSRVYPNKVKEVGWGPIQFSSAAKNDALFLGLPDELSVLHWHGDTFDLPEGVIHLASSSKCQNQAFRYGEHVYGFQFHLEVTPSMLEKWTKSEEDVAYIRSAGKEPSEILNETPLAFSKLKTNSNLIFERFFKTSFISRPMFSLS